VDSADASAWRTWLRQTDEIISGAVTTICSQHRQGRELDNYARGRRLYQLPACGPHKQSQCGPACAGRASPEG
jgi:hypothetical protein